MSTQFFRRMLGITGLVTWEAPPLHALVERETMRPTMLRLRDDNTDAVVLAQNPMALSHFSAGIPSLRREVPSPPADVDSAIGNLRELRDRDKITDVVWVHRERKRTEVYRIPIAEVIEGLERVRARGGR